MQLKYHTEHSSPKSFKNGLIIPKMRLAIPKQIHFRPKTNTPFSTLLVKPRKLFAPFPTKFQRSKPIPQNSRSHSIGIENSPNAKELNNISIKHYIKHNWGYALNNLPTFPNPESNSVLPSIIQSHEKIDSILCQPIRPAWSYPLKRKINLHTNAYCNMSCVEPRKAENCILYNSSPDSQNEISCKIEDPLVVTFSKFGENPRNHNNKSPNKTKVQKKRNKSLQFADAVKKYFFKTKLNFK